MYMRDRPVFLWEVFAAWRGLAGALGLLVLAGAGCAHSDKASRLGSFLTAEPPLFLSGPCALLLTNTGGYVSHLTVARGSTPDRASELSGELQVRGDKLFFSTEAAGSRKEGGAMSYIWDTSRQSGFILSDALQGYAPIGSSLRYTNLTLLDSGGKQTTKPGEHQAGSAQDVAVAGSDGLLTNFRVWRSPTAPAWPDRIEALSGANLFTLKLTRTRPSQPAPSTFEPPDGFTKYDTAQNMVHELIARQQNLRHKPEEPRDREAPASVQTQPRSRVTPE